MRQLSHYFLNPISIDILEMIYWYEDESIYDPVICNNSSSNCSKSSLILHDHPPILQSLYPILDLLNINPSNFYNKHFGVIFLKDL